MIKAVLLDFDGTILDTSGSIFKGFEYVFSTYRKDLKVDKEFYKSLLGPALYEVFPKYFDGDCEFYVEEYRKASGKCLTKEYVSLFPNAIETLKQLKEKGIKLVVVTSRFNPSLRILLDEFDLYKYFDFIVSGEILKNYKPDPESINIVLDKFNLKSSEVIMIGDHKNDILCGKNANCLTAGVKYSANGIEPLVESKVDYIINDLSEIINIVDEIK